MSITPRRERVLPTELLSPRTQAFLRPSSLHCSPTQTVWLQWVGESALTILRSFPALEEAFSAWSNRYPTRTTWEDRSMNFLRHLEGRPLSKEDILKLTTYLGCSLNPSNEHMLQIAKIIDTFRSHLLSPRTQALSLPPSLHRSPFKTVWLQWFQRISDDRRAICMDICTDAPNTTAHVEMQTLFALQHKTDFFNQANIDLLRALAGISQPFSWLILHPSHCHCCSNDSECLPYLQTLAPAHARELLLLTFGIPNISRLWMEVCINLTTSEQRQAMIALPGDLRKQMILFWVRNVSQDCYQEPWLLPFLRALATNDLSRIDEPLRREITKWLQNPDHRPHIYRLLNPLMLSPWIESISNDDPLYIELLHATIEAQPRDSSPRNPYNLHRKLQTWRQEVLALPFQQLAVSRTTLVAFDLEKMRDCLLRASQAAPTWEDLPPYSPDILETWFINLREKIDALSIDKRKEAIDLITKISGGQTLERLKISLQSPYLKHLFRSINPTPHPSVYSVLFHRIIESILKQPKESPEGDLFSPQEMALLNVASSITSCSKGQEEGLRLSGKFLDREPLQNLELDFAKILEDVFEDTIGLLVEKICRTSAPHQISHQTGYLRNILSPRYGIQEPYSFDPHTAFLYSQLLDLPLPELVQIADETLGQGLIAKVQKKFSQKLALDPTLLNQIRGLWIERARTPLHECFTEDGTGLTQAGAIALLVGAGIFKQPL